MTHKPSVFYYNPTCEMAVGNGLPHYHPPALVSALQNDLSFLMSYLAKPSDWVLVNDEIPESFKNQLSSAGFLLPKYVYTDAFFDSGKFISQQKKSFEPWGISPAILHKITPHLDSFDEDYLESGMSQWKQQYRSYFSRETALLLLEKILAEKIGADLLSEELKPTVCHTILEVESCLKKHQGIVLKAPWSCSGRGTLFLNIPQLNASNKQWINGVLNSQKSIMAEPILNKVMDFSMHFKKDGTGIHDLGTTCFETFKGQYRGSYLEEYPDFITKEMRDIYNNRILNNLSQTIGDLIQQLNLFSSYTGVFGVDAMICRNREGKLFIQPCVEINLRYNMGTISLALRKQLPDAKGYWKTIFSPKAELESIRDALTEKHTPQFQDNKINSGFLPLTPMEGGKRFASYLMLNTGTSL